jgi:hypothetical protein
MVDCLLEIYAPRIKTLVADLQPADAGTVADTDTAAELPPSVPLPPGQVLRLSPNSVPATGEQQAILSIGRFGRYSISTRSPQGTAFKVVSRVSGPGDDEGEVGKKDGRLDLFLDPGDYKLLVSSTPNGSGTAAIEAHEFQELNGAVAPRLIDLKLVAGELGDYQQRSYWLEVTSRRTVAIEAAGRNLTDLRLWKDGNWLVGVSPAEETLEPEPGKPLVGLRLSARLEPGLYLLTAYGGPTLPWEKSADVHPFYLRMGIPTLAEAGRQAYQASPFGIDRFLVPASASYFRLELPEAEAASLSVAGYSETYPFLVGDRHEITKKSLLPVAEAETDSLNNGWRVVTVRRQAGKPYILQHFRSVEVYTFDRPGPYWISTLHSGYGTDSVDATALLTSRPRFYGSEPERVVRAAVPRLDATTNWQRRFNLLDELTVFFRVTERGTYTVESSGAAEADHRFEPFIKLQFDYKAPEYRASGAGWELEPGTAEGGGQGHPHAHGPRLKGAGCRRLRRPDLHRLAGGRSR